MSDDAVATEGVNSEEPVVIEESTTSEVVGEAEPETQTETQAETKAEEKPKPESKAQKRIRQLVHEREAERAEKETLRQKIAAMEAERYAQNVPQTPVAPNRNQFEYEEDYHAALITHAERVAEAKAEEKIRQHMATQSQSQSTADNQVKLKAQGEVIQKQLNEAATKYPDFDESRENVAVFNKNVSLMDAIGKSPNVGDLVYHLGKDIEVLEKISRMPPAEMIRELGRIEARINTSPSAVKKITKAPPPISPVGASAGSSNKKVNDMSFEEIEAKYKAMNPQRRRKG